MKKLIIAILAVAGALPVAAQDTYEGAKIMTEDLNGTARYVGMGGAMDALGADISTIATNPAGIGLFRHPVASVSLGVVSQQDVKKFDQLSKTNVSFDQIGFVYSSRTDIQSFVNFGFNFHKSRNFDQILSVADTHMGGRASMNKLAYGKHKRGKVDNGGYSLDFNNSGELMGYEDNNSNYRANTYSQWDYLLMNALNAEQAIDPQTGEEYTDIGYVESDVYNFDCAHRGWISEYDFNLSGNINDRVYLGLTIGIHDVNYKGYSEYTEGLLFANGSDAGIVTLADERKIEGTGYDVKAGIIFRPVEFSPFRIGVSVSTPTWYKLTSTNSTVLFNQSATGSFDKGENGESYDFKLYTPWKFGLSAGTTFGTMLAVGASVDYADYGSTDVRINDGYYDYYGDEGSFSDRAMKDNIDRSLKGMATFKIGAELKPDPCMAVRLGYNYVSPMYEKDGVRDMTLNSPGVMYASTTDYVNWESTNRITCGLGYKTGNVSLDLAYQYSTTNGKFYPFQPDLTFNDFGANENNVCSPADVSNKRHQLLFTLGYTF